MRGIISGERMEMSSLDGRPLLYEAFVVVNCDLHGETLGIVKFAPGSVAALVDIMARLVAAGGLREWAPRAFAEFARTHPLHAIGTRGLPWIEIDFPQDYTRAVNEILPQIEADAPSYPQLVAAAGWDGRTARTDRRVAAFFDRRTTSALLADGS